MSSVGIVKPQAFRFVASLQFAERAHRLATIILMVETYGELNADKSNAVLICHALNAPHIVAG